MNDSQEVKIGMTDGDDSQELQPTCIRGLHWNEQKTKELIDKILSHPELHDLITHLHDFKGSIEFELERIQDLDNKSYAEKQLRVVNKLIQLTTK